MTAQFDPILGQLRDGAVTAAEQIAGITRGSAAEKAAFQALASGVVATFADLLAVSAPTTGRQLRVAAPVIAGGIAYTRWIYTSGGWRLDGEQQLLADYVPASGLAQTARQIVKTVTISAGLLTKLRTFRCYAEVFKSGTTDAVSAIDFRLGAGLTSDSVMSSSAGLIAASRKYAFDSIVVPVSATQLRYIFSGASGYGSGASTSQAYPVNITTVNTDAADSMLTVQVSMSGAVDIPGVANFIIWGS